MGCVHTYQGKHAIERCDSLNHIQSTMEKIGENNRKIGKISQTISQVPTPKLKRDKIQARWASNISSKNMLEKV